MRILFAVPTPESLSPLFALKSLPKLISYSEHKLGVEISLAYEQGVRTDKNRNTILYHALNDPKGYDYILWLDADMVYPHDMLEKFLSADKDIIGCLYFRRKYPHAPVGFVYNHKDNKSELPYVPVDFRKLPENDVIEVDGLGFGGMLVKTSVYNALGEEKWMNYDTNYHLPYQTVSQRSHDLVFCETCKQHGFKIHMHTGVRPGHITDKVVTSSDWDIDSIEKKTEKEKVDVLVVMPATDYEMADKTMKLMEERAGYDFHGLICMDEKRVGFTRVLNDACRGVDANYYVYTAQDAFVGRNWLLNAINTQKKTGAGLVAFNDGKWEGKLASFGLVEGNWAKKNYGGDIFFDGYNSHYGDTELTDRAINEGKFAYDPDAVMVEIDYEKDRKSVNTEDKLLYNERKKLFNGRFS